MSLPSTVDADTYSDAFQRAIVKVRATIPAMGTDRPRHGRPDLTYVRCGEKTWVDGFWSGQLWLAYDETGDATFLEAARAQRPYFERRLERPETHDHDLGFLYSLSVVADHRITGDEPARDLGLRAAEALAGRFNEAGGFLRAWNDWNRFEHSQDRDNAGRMIIDTLENLSLLYWASAESGDARYARIATTHAQTARERLVREDGSTYHLFDFDPTSGAPLGGGTHQGYADDSCWSRGQAWGVHGFTMIAERTGDRTFLDTAARIADYALARLPDDGVPHWDFDLPPEAPHPRDTSAAAILASGLQWLARHVDGERAARYEREGLRILDALVADYAIPLATPSEGLLTHGASNVPDGVFDVMLPYADYFYLEALLRAQGRHRFYW